MPAGDKAPVSADPIEDAQAPSSDSSLEQLRRILMRRQDAKIEELESGLDQLERQIYDEAALIQMIAPVLGEAIRLNIKEARDEMIDALYPIIGKVVQRAVAEAVSDLARSLDAQVKRSFNLRRVWWRFRARVSGATEAQIRLREMLPFAVTDILLIHRESGLLLAHLPGKESAAADTDLLSGMLTAIRDFAQDTMGMSEQEGLGEITFGDQRILIEAHRYTYLAVLVNGIAPTDFRNEMRNALIEIEHDHAEMLGNYQGDAQPLFSVNQTLQPLLANAEPEPLSATQKRVLAAALSGLVVLLVICGLIVNWGLQASRQVSAPAAAVLPSTAPAIAMPASATATETQPPTATASPTPYPKPSQTHTPLPSPTQSATPAPDIGILLGNVWMHTGPSQDTTRLGVVLTVGERVEVLAMEGNWVRVRLLAEGQNEVTGWIPASLLGLTIPIPERLITPSAAP